MIKSVPSARLNALSLSLCAPVSVTAELTRRCPLSCLHCYLPETRGRSARQRELSTAGWKRILSGLAAAGGLYLVFTGGEPLLRPDLAELCRHAKKLRFDVRVFSTGHGLTPTLAAELKAAGISAFEISFYGGPAVHDRVTGARGSFARSLAAARLLKKKGVAVKMKTPLMTMNSGHAGWLVGLASREGFSISFDLSIAPGNDGDRAVLRYRLSGAPLRRAVMRVYGGAKRPEKASEEAYPKGFICGAGRNVCAVGPSGELYPCLQLPVKLGDLTKRPFTALWNGSAWLERWRRLSVKDLKGCAGCEAAGYCGLCPGLNLLETGDPLEPSPQTCEVASALRAAVNR